MSVDRLPAIHDRRSASVEAWKQATRYKEDMEIANEKCKSTLESIEKRNAHLHAYLRSGKFDEKGRGNPADIRPLTPSEICAFHKAISDTEKNAIMISTTIIKDANRDMFTEYIRLSLIHI